MWKSLMEHQISDRWELLLEEHLLSDLNRLPASQSSELVSQQRKASSKCLRRQKLRCLPQTPMLPPIPLQLKGRHLLLTIHPGRSGSTCARSQSSMSMAAHVRQGESTNPCFSLSPSKQVSWWSAQEPWDPVLSGRAWDPPEALSKAHPGHLKGQQREGVMSFL